MKAENPSNDALRDSDGRSAPIFQLPSELLIRIFLFNALRGFKLYTCQNEIIRTRIPNQLKDTINASQVCAQWRMTAINAPELWSHFIDPTHPNAQWNELLLGRSRDHAISILQQTFGDDNASNEANKLSKAKKIAAKLAEFKVWSKPWFFSLEDTSASNTWSRLEFFCMRTGTTDRRDYTLPRGVPGEATPILKHLHLHGCGVQDREHLLETASTLTHLVYESPPTALLPDVNTWVNALEKFENLKGLHLADLWESSNLYEEGNLARILGSAGASFRKYNAVVPVEECSFSDVSQICAQFISQITFPNLRILSLNLGIKDIDSSSPENYPDYLFPELRNILSSMVTRSLFQRPALEIHNGQIRCIDLYTDLDPTQSPSTLANDLEEISGGVDLYFSGILRKSEKPQETTADFLDLFSPLFPRIQYLHVEAGSNFSAASDNLNFLLEQCPSLRRIEDVTFKVWKVLLPRLIPGIALDIPSPLAPTDSSEFLPSLEEMVLCLKKEDVEANERGPKPKSTDVINVSDDGDDSVQQDANGNEENARSDPGTDVQQDANDGEENTENDLGTERMSSYAVYDQIVRLCSHRLEIGRPLRTLLHPPYRDFVDGSEAFLLDLMIPLRSLGVRVIY